jgi:hypothetical protein
VYRRSGDVRGATLQPHATRAPGGLDAGRRPQGTAARRADPFAGTRVCQDAAISSP